MTEHWRWPQWVLIGCYGLGAFYHLSRDGEAKKPERYNFGAQLRAIALSAWFLWVRRLLAVTPIPPITAGDAAREADRVSCLCVPSQTSRPRRGVIARARPGFWGKGA